MGAVECGMERRGFLSTLVAGIAGAFVKKIPVASAPAPTASAVGAGCWNEKVLGIISGGTFTSCTSQLKVGDEILMDGEKYTVTGTRSSAFTSALWRSYQ